MPNLSRSRSDTGTGSFAAPDRARRTAAKASAGASSKWEKATHIDGRAGDHRDPAGADRLQRRGRIEALHEQRSVAPTERLRPRTTLSPKMWYAGITP